MRIVPPNSSYQRRVIASLAVAALTFTACGGDDDSTGDQTSSSSGTSAPAATGSAPASESTDAGTFPVTIEHKYGSTTIPAEPARVVSVGFTDQDFILALGVTPVGIRDWYGEQPFGTWSWAQDELGSAEPELIASDDLSIEQVAALEPDLIVGISSGMTVEQYETLSRIAPTVAQSGEYVDFGAPWQDQTLMTGLALGKAAEAEALVADLEAQFAQVRDDHPEFAGATAAVGFYFNDQPGAYASQDGRSRIMSDFGFAIPTEFDELAGESFFASFSAEQIDLLDTDVIVWIGGDELTITNLIDSPLRGGLGAVQDGREVFADVELGGAFSFGSPLSLPWLIERLVPELALAVDGDPSTVVPSAEVIGAADSSSTGSSTPGSSTPAAG